MTCRMLMRFGPLRMVSRLGATEHPTCLPVVGDARLLASVPAVDGEGDSVEAARVARVRRAGLVFGVNVSVSFIKTLKALVLESSVQHRQVSTSGSHTL